MFISCVFSMKENDIETDIGAIQEYSFYQQMAPISCEHKQLWASSRKAWRKAELYFQFPRLHFPHIACQPWRGHGRMEPGFPGQGCSLLSVKAFLHLAELQPSHCVMPAPCGWALTDHTGVGVRTWHQGAL